MLNLAGELYVCEVLWWTLVEEFVRMAVFSKWGQIVVVAGSMTSFSIEAAYLESPKAAPTVENKEMKCTVEKTVEQKQQEAKVATQRSKAPIIGPQFDGLNFYETFVVEQKQREAKATAQRSKAPKIAREFDIVSLFFGTEIWRS